MGKRVRAKRSATGTKRVAKVKPIDLYFWPTPNGWKISITLEECGQRAR
jgi:hypothetical protein